jgi:hypothetical protein
MGDFGDWAAHITDTELLRIAGARAIDAAAHRCGCDVCAHTSQLCPATRSSLMLAVLEPEQAPSLRCALTEALGALKAIAANCHDPRNGLERAAVAEISRVIAVCELALNRENASDD